MVMAKTKKNQARTESLLCQLKNKLCELMLSYTQFIRQAILRYEDSVMKRQSITHIVNACSILAESQYRKRHDKVGTYVHWLLCKKHHLQSGDKWYTNTHRDKVTESEGYQTQFASTSKRECQIIVFVIPGDQILTIK